MEKTIDIPYEEALEITKEDIIQTYECAEEEAEEAMKYVDLFLEDYDPKIEEEYDAEYTQLLEKLEAAAEKEEKNDPS
jgi:hypothetical protein